VKPLSGMLRTLAFGAVAALGVMPWQLLFGGLVGRGAAFAAYCLAGACVYPAVVAPTLRAAFVALCLTVPLAGGVALIAPSPLTAVSGAALIVPLGRAASYRARPARVVVLEMALFVLGCGLAQVLGGPSYGGLALGLWCYFLVQSAYFLWLQPSPAPEPAAPMDPFEQAQRRAEVLLQRR